MPKPSYEQQEALCEFLEKHPQMANARLYTADARHKYGLLWQRVAAELNAHRNGASKIPEGKLSWAKYWADKKAYLKKIAVRSNVSAGHAGPTPLEAPNLSDLDRRFLAVLGKDFGRSDASDDPFAGEECDRSDEEIAEPESPVKDPIKTEQILEELDAVYEEDIPVWTTLHKTSLLSPPTSKRKPKATRKRILTAGKREELRWNRMMETRRLHIEQRKLIIEEKRFKWEQEKCEKYTACLASLSDNFKQLSEVIAQRLCTKCNNKFS